MLERVPTLPRPAHRAFRKSSGAVEKSAANGAPARANPCINVKRPHDGVH